MCVYSVYSSWSYIIECVNEPALVFWYDELCVCVSACDYLQLRNFVSRFLADVFCPLNPTLVPSSISERPTKDKTVHLHTHTQSQLFCLSGINVIIRMKCLECFFFFVIIGQQVKEHRHWNMKTNLNKCFVWFQRFVFMLSFTKYTDKTRAANNNYFCRSRSTSCNFFLSRWLPS